MFPSPSNKSLGDISLNLDLTPDEVRVLGCLMEKSVTTPDQYPLTLNALRNACNQKSSRDPVVSLDEGEVLRTIRALQDKHLVTSKENFKSRVEKYDHRFCNTPFADLQLDSAEFAIICLLLLRGPQTPGELRTRSNRLHQFADNQAVTAALTGLMTREEGAVVARLARKPGRQDSEYMHLFSGELESEPPEEARIQSPAIEPSAAGNNPLEERLEALEREVQQLRDEIKRLTSRSSE